MTPINPKDRAKIIIEYFDKWRELGGNILLIEVALVLEEYNRDKFKEFLQEFNDKWFNEARVQ